NDAVEPACGVDVTGGDADAVRVFEGGFREADDGLHGAGGGVDGFDREGVGDVQHAAVKGEVGGLRERGADDRSGPIVFDARHRVFCHDRDIKPVHVVEGEVVERSGGLRDYGLLPRSGIDPYDFAALGVEDVQFAAAVEVHGGG